MYLLGVSEFSVINFVLKVFCTSPAPVNTLHITHTILMQYIRTLFDFNEIVIRKLLGIIIIKIIILGI